MFEMELKGCRSEPLLSYLKALGVFRLVAEHVDQGAAAAWRNESLVLKSRLTREEVVSFFTDDYVPTPIVGPWAGGSGFFGKDDRTSVDALVGSSVHRLKLYRTVVERVRDILTTMGIDTKPEENKAALLRVYRRELPDEFVRWMDAVLVLQEDGQTFPPLLGTGGNDGRLDFTRNFMDRLVDLGIHLDPAAVPDDLKKQRLRFLENSLFGEPCPNLSRCAVGQFHPGGVGGPNAGQGMGGPSLVNPWDFVLMLEGALVFAGSLSRRMGISGTGKAVFPFTVSASQVGDGAMDRADAGNARGEIWMPIWNRFASLPEISLVFSEGRAELSGKQCRNGVDLARAIAGLGVDRGLHGFVRYGFLRRSGKAFLATPLGRFDVTLRPQVDLLREIERYGWLDSFRRACADKTTPSRFTSALRRLDAAIMDYCRYGGVPFLNAIFRTLGRIERELALLPGRPIAGREIGPIPSLSSDWTTECDDGTAEFRIGVALASIQKKGEVGSMSAHLEPVERSQWVRGWGANSGHKVWNAGSLCQNLLAVLERRLMDAARGSMSELPLDATCPVGLDDIITFLNGRTDDARIEDYLWSSILVHRPKVTHRPVAATNPYQPPSRAYLMLKLVFLPSNSALRSVADDKPIRPDSTILAHLRSGNVDQALNVAARRLRVSGYIPMPGPAGGKNMQPSFVEQLSPARLAAALIIPLWAKDTDEVRRIVLREKADTY
ncbi:MAG: type I-U CRISPR-associated protein Csx17 [Pseudomonadota bacterium]